MCLAGSHAILWQRARKGSAAAITVGDVIAARDLAFQAARATKALFEAVNTAAGVGHFLTAREEGMAGRAHVEADVAAEGRAGFDDVATAALHGHGRVFGMDVGFHGLVSCCRHQCGLPGTVTLVKRDAYPTRPHASMKQKVSIVQIDRTCGKAGDAIVEAPVAYR